MFTIKTEINWDFCQTEKPRPTATKNPDFTRPQSQKCQVGSAYNYRLINLTWVPRWNMASTLQSWDLVDCSTRRARRPSNPYTFRKSTDVMRGSRETLKQSFPWNLGLGTELGRAAQPSILRTELCSQPTCIFAELQTTSRLGSKMFLRTKTISSFRKMRHLGTKYFQTISIPDSDCQNDGGC